jgi:hypothetical protein
MDTPRRRLGLRPKTTLAALGVIWVAGSAGAWRGASVVEELLGGPLEFASALVPAVVQLALTCLLAGACLALAAFRPARRRPRQSLCAAVTLILLVGGIYTVDGEWRAEFSPERFEHRTVSWYAIPFPHVRISPLRVDMKPESALARYLKAEGYLSSSGAANTGWDPCASRWIGYRGLRGHATWFARTIQVEGSFWLSWSKLNPKQARVIWPQVIRHAQRRNYKAARQILWEVKLSL